MLPVPYLPPKRAVNLFQMEPKSMNSDTDDNGEDGDSEDADDYHVGIELSPGEELCFFIQFFIHLIILYSICYLCGMYRFLMDQLRPVIQFLLRDHQHHHHNHRQQHYRRMDNRHRRQIPLTDTAIPRVEGQPTSTTTNNGTSVQQEQQRTQIHPVPPQQQRPNNQPCCNRLSLLIMPFDLYKY